LTLPFLDYVLMRHFGELGEMLQAAYATRLQRFKAQVQDLASERYSHVMLVRLRTDHTFRRQLYTVRDGKLEVNDAM
jgi:formyltetrahydrofolate hydrolase